MRKKANFGTILGVLLLSFASAGAVQAAPKAEKLPKTMKELDEWLNAKPDRPAMLDANMNGKVDEGEKMSYLTHVQNIGKKVPPPQDRLSLEEWVKENPVAGERADANKDGKVDYREFQAFSAVSPNDPELQKAQFEALLKNRPELMEKVDLNKDGVVADAERSLAQKNFSELRPEVKGMQVVMMGTNDGCCGGENPAKAGTSNPSARALESKAS